ncbi:MAG: sodium:proton antiporter [Granulosicoccus sp.]|nr:sodium:proton antiporter [Granulosicoccus sp.]
MSLLSITSILITVSALFAFVNYRTLKLPNTIGIMVISLLFSLALVLMGNAGFGDAERIASNIVGQIEFDEALLNGMLGFLLFAGAMHINIDHLLARKWTIGLLASVGVITSMFLVAACAYYLFQLFGFYVPFIYCLLFGSLISPTDPIAVMGILKTAGASKSLEIKIAGESLFNDGVAIVVFLAIFGMAVNGEAFDPQRIGLLFVQEAFGGAVFGFICGWVVLQMLKRVDNYHVEILLTLALVSGGATAAAGLHLSAPIAVVVAGLMIGNHGRRDAMSNTTVQHLDSFWELIDEILNAVLFLIIGLEVMVLSLDLKLWTAGVVMAVLVLICRLISVGIPVNLLRKLNREFHPHAVKILTWGGLRGGISVALALSIPPGPERDLIVAVTYVIVVLSILVQGLSIGKLIKATAEPETDG